MDKFPRTMAGGVSLPRLIVGTNWFLGYSRSSIAKDRFIKNYQTRERITSVLKVFLDHGIDAVMVPLSEDLDNAVRDAEQISGRRMIRLYYDR